MKYLLTMAAALKECKWGAWSLMSLYVSLLSGVIVGLQYEYTDPYYSVASIDLIVPFGAYFRSLHFYSSQFFFLFLSAHFVFTHSETKKYSRWEWIKITSTLPIALFLLFTGYILRGDNTGASAGLIAENIAHAIPIVGPGIDKLLFSITESGMRKIYVHHVISFDLLLLMAGWNHLKKHRVFIKDHPILLVAIFCFPLVILAPIEPEQLGVSYISGPWFFLGLQELLRYFSPMFAGVIVPTAFLIAMYLVHPQDKHRKSAIIFISIWLVFYFILSIFASLR